MPPDEEVLDLEAPPSTEVPKGPKPADTITIPKAELEALRRERDEAKNSERFWADRARGNGHAPAEPAADDDEPIETGDLLPKPVSGKADVDEAIFNDPDKWLEAISKGPKAIQALVRNATSNFVDAETVAEIARKVARRTVDVERTKISADNTLLTRYPGLSDKNSEFFKVAAEEYNELIEFDPEAKKSRSTLLAAAKAAKLRLEAKAPAKGKQEEEDDYDYVEDNRRTRIAAQDGSRNGRGPRVEEPEDSLGPQARQIARAFGVSDEEVIAERKKLEPTRRRR